MLSVALPVEVRVTVCAALVVPTAWFAKVRLPGLREIPVPTPVPESETFCGES